MFQVKRYSLIYVAGLQYNGYAIILGDILESEGELIFEECTFTNWSIEMHYGIDVAVPVKTFTVINSVFINFKMLPLWSILNIKETK